MRDTIRHIYDGINPESQELIQCSGFSSLLESWPIRQAGLLKPHVMMNGSRFRFEVERRQNA
jgi:hypothetical protein